MVDARATGGATAEDWQPEGARELEGMRAAAWMTAEETAEVEETIALVVASVRRGDISSHFANWLIKGLAEEKAEAWRLRQERQQRREGQG